MPKRKAPAKAAAKPAKMQKTASTVVREKASAALKKQVKKGDSSLKKHHVVDKSAHGAIGYRVYEDYDAMLNQTNIGHNNNKYYVAQLWESENTKNSYVCHFRWGRVGEPGQQQQFRFSNLDAAQKCFKKKFNDKTRNSWDQRGNFFPCKGKYTLIEMGDENSDDDDDDDAAQGLVSVSVAPKADFADSTLDGETRKFLELIFDDNTFSDQMAQFKLDTKKMPLGKLSKTQISKGFDVLDEIEQVIDKKKSGNLTDLTSKFYTVIPHDFGRMVPPTLRSADAIRQKKDMLLVLADIEIAQNMLKENKNKRAKEAANTKKKQPKRKHPLDEKYEMLDCTLQKVANNTKERQVIEEYIQNTGRGYLNKLHNIWRVDRHDERHRFAKFHGKPNRKLLWHGTKVAVIAAILKTGLRIMPHSGGRVGSGIYFASEHSKSAAYVGTSRTGRGFMFLTEVYLGKEHHTLTGGCGIKSPPAGYDSVVAIGTTEPDPALDTQIEIDGTKVTVPRGKPKPLGGDRARSNFSQSEYLVYSEAQARLRYILELSS